MSYIAMIFLPPITAWLAGQMAVSSGNCIICAVITAGLILLYEIKKRE